MKIVGRFKASSLLSLGVALVGLITFSLIIQQPQSYRSSAKKPPKPTPTIAVPSPTPSECSCVGKGKCAKLSSELECEANSRCTWSCPVSAPTLIIPNGGEVWERGNTYDIVWEQSQVSEGSVALHLYTRDQNGDNYIGAIEYLVSNNVGTNSYSWAIPQKGSPLTNPPQDGDNIIIQVTYYDSNSQLDSNDKSDSTFAITSPKPTLIIPNGGEVWVRGIAYDIVWEQSQVSDGSVALHLFTRDSTGDNYIGAVEYYVSNNVGTNSYSWTIPQKGSVLTNPPEDGDNAIIQVTYYDSNSQLASYDRSDSTFTVKTQTSGPTPTPTSGPTPTSTSCVPWGQCLVPGESCCGLESFDSTCPKTEIRCTSR